MWSAGTPPGLFQRQTSSPGPQPDGFSQRSAPPTWPDSSQPAPDADAAAASQILATGPDADRDQNTGTNVEMGNTHKLECMAFSKALNKDHNKRDATTDG